jgi:polyphenol oxidase
MSAPEAGPESPPLEGRPLLEGRELVEGRELLQGREQAGQIFVTQPLFVTSPLLTRTGVRHGFFLRTGGVSAAPFDSLNFSISVGDDPASVQANRELGAKALGVSPDRVFRVSQVHGCEVVVVAGPEESSDTAVRPADAVVSGAAQAACAVITADCVPVLVASRRTGHVAAIHSGWRGFVAGVIPRAIEALDALGAGDFVAAIGPHISVAAFEVSSEVANELCALAKGHDIVDSTKPRPHVDLRLLARVQLQSVGLDPSSIDDVMGCTYLEPSRFFSYRRDGARSGRQLAAIVTRT